MTGLCRLISASVLATVGYACVGGWVGTLGATSRAMPPRADGGT